MIKNKSGVWGELFTARYLRDNGFKIITSNYSCRFGEIDLIAMKDDILCFVEVKTRAQDTLNRPMEAVDEDKQNKMRMTADSFLSYSKLKNAVRFDVCEVWLDEESKPVKLNYITGAF
ncbi:MAG: YraN family protein [Clostridia bacterium]|nr:YraN family protein [Clostridia bacterium]MBR6702784.1 YraN family protein [Clostridia bacterium]